MFLFVNAYFVKSLIRREITLIMKRENVVVSKIRLNYTMIGGSCHCSKEQERLFNE